MYIVIFKARLAPTLLNSMPEWDNYIALAQQLRQRALSDYGCIEFVSNTENQQEIALSY